MEREQFDVVVVGASISGCTAAMLFARYGLRVALLEAHRDPAHYKRACTHFIQASAVPTVRRLGLVGDIESAGGTPNRLDIWTRWGWISPAPRAEGSAHGYNVRRQVLDPLLRSAATDEPGVRLLTGHRAVDLLHDGTAHRGVVAHGPRGPVSLHAALVVGADGRHSTTAGLARVRARSRDHGRFVYFAAFEGVRLHTTGGSQMWMLDPDVAYAFPNGDLTVLSVMPTKEKLAEFRADIGGHFFRAVRRLPDGPDLSDATQVTPFSGVTNYACVSRRPIAPGVALVGDAAMTSDYLWGTGCGFAFQTAEWLVDATAPLVQAGPQAIAAGLERYRRQHRRRLSAHQWLMSDYAGGRPLQPPEKLVLSAAARDARTADRLQRFSERSVSPAHLFAPTALARCLRVNHQHSRAGRVLMAACD
jgi:2-polyprenyl-6-methoxyphenol hydroxylase-like FAD-dependent oxidoreductase